jgi:hypothetical protein
VLWVFVFYVEFEALCVVGGWKKYVGLKAHAVMSVCNICRS